MGVVGCTAESVHDGDSCGPRAVRGMYVSGMSSVVDDVERGYVVVESDVESCYGGQKEKKLIKGAKEVVRSPGLRFGRS